MKNDILQIARSVFEVQQESINEVKHQLDHDFVKAINLLLKSKGKIVITGMGKSGLIAQKVAATMASTGTLAIFMHPSEAAHGDLGVLHKDDILITIGKSGESEEIIHILPTVRKMNIKIISLLGNLNSTTAKLSDINISTKVSKEASPYQLAPTSSTTASLVMGDAIAMVLQELKEFKSEDFALFHPAGQLGKRLLLNVSDVMHQNDRLPIINEKDSTENLILLMTQFGMGAIGVCNSENNLLGLITDGDLRRTLSTLKGSFFSKSLTQIMTVNPLSVKPEMNAYEALVFMEKERTINHLAVIDINEKFVGMISLHDLIKIGL
jgi:arabinose-5-phosphate isomerase